MGEFEVVLVVPFSGVSVLAGETFELLQQSLDSFADVFLVRFFLLEGEESGLTDTA